MWCLNDNAKILSFLVRLTILHPKWHIQDQTTAILRALFTNYQRLSVVHPPISPPFFSRKSQSVVNQYSNECPEVPL